MNILGKNGKPTTLPCGKKHAVFGHFRLHWEIDRSFNMNILGKNDQPKTFIFAHRRQFLADLEVFFKLKNLENVSLFSKLVIKRSKVIAFIALYLTLGHGKGFRINTALQTDMLKTD